MLHRAGFLIITALLGLARPASADVFVSDMTSMFVPGGTQEIKPSHYYYNRLPMVEGAEYTVTAETSGDLRVMLCDAPNFRRFEHGGSYRCYQKKREGRFSVSAPVPRDGPMFVVIENENILVGKHVSWRTQVVFPTPERTVRKMRQAFCGIVSSLHNILKAPDFDVIVKPCGEVNAYSEKLSGDITLCSELIFEVLQQQNKAAAVMIMFHEFGHTLLNLWGEPNHGNERTADEFATVFALIGSRSEYVHDWIRWFRENENLAGELRAARQGDLHMLTPQRIEAIERVLRRPNTTIERWTRTIYPHMINHGLRTVLEEGHPGANPPLARKILRERDAM